MTAIDDRPNRVGVSLGDLTSREARHMNAGLPEHLENRGHALLDPAILSREIGRTIRFNVDSE
jgi:hypothetical protein